MIAYQRNKNPKKVISVLGEIQESGGLIQILLPHSNKIYTSTIKAIDDTKKLLLLDVLNPDESNTKVVDKTVFIAKSKFNGSDISFHTQISAVSQSPIVNDNQDRFNINYLAYLPRQINYLNRRSGYRFKLEEDSSPEVIFITADGKRMQGRVENLSIGGFRVSFDQPSECFWKVGDRIENCVLQLTPSITINGSAEIRYCDYNKEVNALTLGICFNSANKIHVSSITQYIDAIDRKLRSLDDH